MGCQILGWREPNPPRVITQDEQPTSAIEADETVDRLEEGWLMAVLDVSDWLDRARPRP